MGHGFLHSPMYFNDLSLMGTIKTIKKRILKKLVARRHLSETIGPKYPYKRHISMYSSLSYDFRMYFCF